MFASGKTAAVASAANYIEDVFSTYLYTGNGSTQTITNGIDLAGKGGLVWTKSRNAGYDHELYDTARGINKVLISNSTAASSNAPNSLPSFDSTGFTLGANNNSNSTGITGASWTFRKQPKFFDVVTYTGTGSATTIAHNLGSVPGCIIVKRTDTTGNWQVYHNGLTSAAYSIQLNLTNAQASATTVWNSTAPTSTVFSVGTNSTVNASGGTYVAYLFAHNAGGFGLTGTDNVITCGTFTLDSINKISVTLGYEPQWLLFKSASGVEGWWLFDNMRGFNYSQTNYLSPNTSAAESSFSDNPSPTATGFVINSASIGSGDYIYIAIRRGPMKVPTSGTSVFSPNATTASVNTKITTNFPVDLQMQGYRPGISNNIQTIDRLRGTGTVASSTSSVPKISTSSTAAESSVSAANGWDNTGFQISTGWNGNNMVYWNFQRAPSFFDEVCYTGTGSARTINHNLGVAPELIITKMRSGGANWMVFSTSALLYGYPSNGFYLNSTNAMDGYNFVTSAPTATTYSVGTGAEYNSNTSTYVSYLFASCSGVSKVGSYTGNGSTQTIDCGFTGGARFVLIKRTDSTGSWYVWDVARGISSGNDPYLLLNSTAAEVTNTDYIDAYSAGFEISSTAPAEINASGGSFIFLAIS